MRRWSSILLALLASASIWFVHNLSREAVAVVSVPVVAQSDIDGRAEFSYDEISVAARCSASGFELLRLERQRKPSVVFFAEDELKYVGGDSYSIPESKLMEKASRIFGKGVNVLAITGKSVECRFAKESCKKVPVEPVQNLLFRRQYMSLTPFVLTPDSVTVYADPQRLGSIERVLTRTISKSDIHSTLRGAVELDCPMGTRLGRSSVEYTMEVSRYVEISSRAELTVRNVPYGRELIIIPSTVDVSFRCPFPLNEDPREDSRFYVDYRDFAASISGTIPVRYSGVPSDVISVTIKPEFCDCLEKTR